MGLCAARICDDDDAGAGAGLWETQLLFSVSTI